MSENKEWNTLPVYKLIGKCTMRKKPLNGDFSFTSSPSKINNVFTDGSFSLKSNMYNDFTLDKKWNDDGWVLAPAYLCNKVGDIDNTYDHNEKPKNIWNFLFW